MASIGLCLPNSASFAFMSTSSGFWHYVVLVAQTWHLLFPPLLAIGLYFFAFSDCGLCSFGAIYASSCRHFTSVDAAASCFLAAASLPFLLPILFLD